MNISDSEIIFKTALQPDKIYVKEQTGRFQKIRRYLNWLLMLSFVLLPIIQYQGQQAIWFDLRQQQFHLFSLVLFPQDFMALVFLFIVAAFVLFWVSAKYGRIWCGFACPQTVWALMFMWIENRIEGNRQQRIAMDKTPWTLAVYGKKLVKHLLWLIISALTAIAFMAYFVPTKELYPQVIHLSTSPLVAGWIAFFALCTYLNAGLVREKMCQHMCPYARFQSVMLGIESKVVTYDDKRGENRGPRKMKQTKPDSLGDCVDCDLCVQVCPVGIDIREGFQAECINCGLCIDACDSTMTRFNYQKGLIKFASQSLPKNTLKQLGYFTVMAIFLVFAVVWSAQRTELEMTVIKDRYVLYREADNGAVENLYQVELINKTNQAKTILLELENDFIRLLNQQTITLKPLENRSINVTTISDEPESLSKFTNFEIKVLDTNKEQTLLSRTGTFQRPKQH